jgi:hypothetical protein
MSLARVIYAGGLSEAVLAEVAPAFAPYGVVEPVGTVIDLLRRHQRQPADVVLLQGDSAEGLAAALRLRKAGESPIVCLVVAHGLTRALAHHRLASPRAHLPLAVPVSRSFLRAAMERYLPPPADEEAVRLAEVERLRALLAQSDQSLVAAEARAAAATAAAAAAEADAELARDEQLRDVGWFMGELARLKATAG